MLRRSQLSLRRGLPRPKATMFTVPHQRVPATHKPHQGGQEYFQHFLLRNADKAALKSTQVVKDERKWSPSATAIPQGAVTSRRFDNMPTDAATELLESQDAYETRRGFNEYNWIKSGAPTLSEGNDDAAAAGGTEQEQSTNATTTTTTPTTIDSDEFVRSRYGYSLLNSKKKGATSATTTMAAAAPGDNSETAPSSLVFSNENTYSQYDLWGERPGYNRHTYFLYLVSRRRNCYAVIFDFEGKRVLPTYTVGNRGLRGGDKGFKGDGSPETAHQVTSQYLNDVIPKIKEREMALGRGGTDKIELVVRVMGFYNGRQGAVRAVTDRADVFDVKYFEDITPFPLNGPRMPRHVYK